jgi:hypothetical protein
MANMNVFLHDQNSCAAEGARRYPVRRQPAQDVTGSSDQPTKPADPFLDNYIV